MDYLKNCASFVSNTINQSLEVLVPVALDASLQLGLQDQKIAKVVSGIFISFSGLNLLRKTAFQGKPISQPTNQNVNHSSNWGTIGVGILATAYGTYNLVTGLMELYSSPEDKVYKAHEGYDEEIEYENTIKFGPYQKCDDRLRFVEEELKSCPGARQLWEDLQDEKAFTVRCTTFEDAPTGAVVDTRNRVIGLSDPSDRMTENLLFELNNLKQAHQISFNQYRACQQDPYTFAENVERIEYDTAKYTFDMAEKCIEQGYWPEGYSTFTKFKNGEWHDFPSYLETQKSNGHYDLYVQSHRERCPKVKK